MINTTRNFIGCSVLLSLMLTPLLAMAQTVRITDEETGDGVENVYIYNTSHSKTAVSNVRGHAILSKFTVQDTIVFQHASYDRLVVAYRDLERQAFRVTLKKRAVSMQEVYVSASRREQSLDRIPQKIARISPDEVRFQNPQTSADILAQSGKVFVQKSQLGGGSPMIRGFAANAVLLALDGIRMNNAIYRSGNLQNVINVDPNMLEGSEVIFGPGSVIYGSDALGGVMNFQTPDPELSYSNDMLVSGHALTRYASANQEQTGHFDLNIGGNQWGSLTSMSYSSFDDLRTGGHFDDKYDWGKRRWYVVRRDGHDRVVPNDNITLQKYSGYELLNLMQKVTFKPSSKLGFNYTFYLSTTSDIPRYDRLIQTDESGNPQYAEWYYGPQRWMLNSLEANIHNDMKLFEDATVTLAMQDYTESRNDRDFQDLNLRNREEDVKVITANVDFDKHFDELSTLYYGLELVHNDVASNAHITNIESGSSRATASRYPDGGSDYDQYAAYAQFSTDISDQWTFSVGGRYSHTRLNARFDSKRFYDFPFGEININTGAMSGSAGLVYRPTDSWQFNVNAASGFRAPNVDDAAKVFDSEPGRVIVPNEHVKPEYTYNVDLGVIRRFGDRGRVELSGYYTWLRDAMVRREFTFAGRDSIVYDGTLSQVQAVVNAGRAYVYGFSAFANMQLAPRWVLQGTVTYTEGMDTTEDIPLRHVAPLFGQLGVTFKHKGLHTEFYTRFNGAKPFDDLSPSEQHKTHLYTSDGTPAWYTLNLKTSYQIDDNFSLSMGMENILDDHYRPYSSGISAPGRNVIMALRASI